MHLYLYLHRDYIAARLRVYIGKIQPNLPFRRRKPIYVGYIQFFGPQKPNIHGSRAFSLEKIQYTIRKGAKGVRILHKIQYKP